MIQRVLLSSSLILTGLACSDTPTDSETTSASASSTETTSNTSESGESNSTTETAEGTTTNGDGDGDSNGDGDGSTGDGDGSTGDGDGSTGDGDGSTGDGDSSTGDGDGDGDGSTGDGDGSTGDGDGSTGDGDGDGDNCADGQDAALSGTVHAPNGDHPVSGALVYITSTPPAGIPQQVYCAECEILPVCTDFVLTESDGTFNLEVFSGTGKYLVVVKGQFMRVTQLDVAPGVTPLSAAETDLPSSNDPGSGLYIPRIAVGMSSPDDFEKVLAKIGLADHNGNGTITPGTQSFDLYNNDSDPSFAGLTSSGSIATLLSDPDLLDDYHILFAPCIGNAGLTAMQDPVVAQNVRDWVEAGGRIYATDYAQQWIHLLFDEYQEFNGEPGNQPTPVGNFDSLATVQDADLLSWLEAMPANLADVNPMNGGGSTFPTLDTLPQVLLTDNYTGIQLPLPSVQGDDGMGGIIELGHTAWLEGPWPGPGGTFAPAVIGQYGCGRLHFTSYHTAGLAHVGMIPQELIMLYSVLEVGVCQEEIPVPE